MIKGSIIASILMLVGCEASDARLMGTWTVDQQATVAMASSKNALWLRNNLAPLTNGLAVSFDQGGLVTVRDGDKTTQSEYSVLHSDDDGMMLSIKSGGKGHRLTVVFQAQRMVLAENNQHVVLRKQ